MATATQRSREILLIDDDEDQLVLLKRLLINLGHHVSTASNVQDGLNEMKKRVPHLILLDFVLNHESALQFIKQKAENAFYSSIPLIVMSANDHAKIISTAMAMGASDFLKKPISSNTLSAKIKQILKDFSFPAVKVENTTTATIEVDGEIEQINEVGCLLNSPVKFSSNRNIDIQSKLFKELEMDYCRYMILEDFGRTPGGYYKNEVSFVGIQEKSSKKIRALRKES